MLEKTLESLLDCKEIQPVHSEGDQPWDKAMDSVSFEKDLGKIYHAFSQLEIWGFSLDII